ncbi:MAG: pre-peptidase C-terminal domain-containing protein [Phycisphaerales bacterium]
MNGDEVIYQEQTQYDNFFNPNVIAFDFAIDADAVNGVIDIQTLSDLDHPGESVAYNIEGIVTGELWTGTDDGIRPFIATINLDDADLAAIAADGNLHIEFTPSSAVDDFGDVSEYVTVGLTYDYAPKVESFSYTLAPKAEWVDVKFVVRFSERVYGSLFGTGHHVHVSAGPENEFVSSTYNGNTRELTVTYKNYAQGSYSFFLDPVIIQSAIRDVSGNLLSLDTAVMQMTQDDELSAGFTVDISPIVQVGQYAQNTGFDASFAYLVTDDAYKLKGSFDYTGDVDHYAIDLQAGLLLTMAFKDFSQSGLLTEVTIYNPAGEVIAYRNDGRPIINGIKINDTGTYIIEVSNSAVVYSPIQYDASINFNYFYEDGYFGLSTNDSLVSAQDLDGFFFEIDSVIEQTSINGVLHSDETTDIPDRDYYKLTLSAGESVSLTLAGGPSVDKLRLLGPDGTTLVEGYDPNYSVVGAISDFIAPVAGTYYIEIEKLLNDRTGIYTLIVTKGATFGHQIPSYFRPHRVSPLGLAVGDVDSDPGYTFQAQAGDALNLWTVTPDFTPPSYPNNLRTRIKLYDPDGTLVGESSVGDPEADARLLHTVEISGTYTVHIESVYGTGPYVLHVEGNTVFEPRFYAYADYPVDGDMIDEALNRLRIHIPDYIRIDTLQAHDLTVNGLPSPKVETAPYDLFYFDLPPGLGNGDYHFEIAEGAILNIHNQPIEPFSLNITVDATPPRIVSSSIREGDVLEPGQHVLALGFDEPIDETGLSLNSVSLHGEPGSAQDIGVAWYTYDPIDYVLSVGFNVQHDGRYTFTTGSSIRDLIGHQLDGEAPQGTLPPGVTGDGEPGGAFVLTFDVDRSDTETITDFKPAAPIRTLGSGTAPIRGYINSEGDTDRYRLDLQPGQMVTVVLEPASQDSPLLSLEVMGEQFRAGGAGEPMTWTYRAPAAGGVVDLVVGADMATQFELTVYLNAVREQDLPAASSSAEPVYDLSGSWVDIPDQPASVATVYGQWQSSVIRQTIDGNILPPGPYTFEFTDMFMPTGDGTLTITARADLDLPNEYLSIGGEGFSFGDVFASSSSAYYRTASINIPMSDLLAMAADGALTFDVTPSPGVNEIRSGGYLTLSIAYPGMRDPAQDAYAVELAAGQLINVMLYSTDDAYAMELVDTQTGAVVAIGEPGGLSNIQTIGYKAARAGRYDIRVHTASGSDYTLAVIRDAGLDTQPNSIDETNAPAQGLDNTDRVLGYVQSPRPDRLFALSRPSPAAIGLSVYELDPLTLETVHEFSLENGIYAYDLAYDGINLYARSQQNGPVWTFDPESGALLHTIDFVNISLFSDLASYGGLLVQQTGANTNQLTFYEPFDAEVLRRLDLADIPQVRLEGLVGAEPRGSLFVTYREYVPETGNVTWVAEVDAVSGQTLNSFSIDQANVSSLAFVADQLYAFTSHLGQLGIYDPSTGQPLSPPQYIGLYGAIAGDGVVPRLTPDRYTLDLQAGQSVTLSTTTPFDVAGKAGANILDPALRVLNPNGEEVAFDSSGAVDGKNTQLAFTATTAGAYTVQVLAEAGYGEYVLNVELAPFLPGDLDHDGFVGIEDLNTVLGNWNQNVASGNLAQGDASGDGFVGIEDLNTVLGNWNATLEPPAVEGDLNSDGFVGIADLNVVLGNWNQSVIPSDLTQGDPSGDGFVGIEDLNTVLGNWNTGIPAAVEAVTLSGDESLAEASAFSTVETTIVTELRHSMRNRSGDDTDNNRSHYIHNPSVAAAWDYLNRRSTRADNRAFTPWSLRPQEESPLVGLWEEERFGRRTKAL